MQEQPSPPENPQPVISEPLIARGPDRPKSKKKLYFSVGILVILIAAGSFFLFKPKEDTLTSTAEQPQTTEAPEQIQKAEGLILDTNKNYGDKYADGILPVGDDNYSTDAAKKGQVYLCNANFVPDAQAGASTRGPWFIGENKWDVNRKYSVQGSVKWDQNITNKISGTNRVITTNGLPDHHTGTFPVSSADPAYAYDRNPNSIKSQSLTYNLAANPAYSSSANCMGGEVGVLLTGVALFNAFDAGGRDAGAWEIQDACEGHPQSSGIYHYHTLSSCIKDISVKTVIGFALDGFPITGPKVGDSVVMAASFGCTRCSSRGEP